MDIGIGIAVLALVSALVGVNLSGGSRRGKH